MVMNENVVTHLPLATQRKAGPVQAWTLIFAMFLPIMAIIALAPALPTLMGHFRYIPNFQVYVPMLLTAPSFCIAVLSPFAGRLSDVFGRRRLLLTAMALYGFGGIAPFFLDNFWAIMGGRLLLGIAEAFILTIGNALLADYFAPNERPKWLAIQGMVGPFLATLVIYGSGFLAGAGWQWPFVVYGLAFPIFVSALLFLWEPDKKQAAEAVTVTRSAFPWRTVVFVSLVTLGTSVLYYVFIIHFSLVLTANGITSESRIGILSAIASIAVPVGAYVYRQLSGRSIFYLLLMVYGLMGLGYIGISLAHDEPWIMAAALIQQLAVGMTIPALVAWALSSLPEQHRGLGMGCWSASFFLGQFVNPIVVGFINQLSGGIVATVMLIGIGCLVIALTVWLPLVYRQNKKLITT